ncbi:arsenate reductase (glutaredoxin) [Legionella sp. km772]|uniref:arsenate reductase (glutaredoxin) n=1 Tax=Legionella sp. km772 TaxID=2498111 RepID=UPI000F8D9089|nr:arsenate reductase (glutaredoxin) [Legionella sp. km772]RUR09878.1 arsenate reductase (glutaredoxin) [Legionella sp. km772]
MDKLIIYHNPRCSKSRQTLDLLQSRGYQPLIVEYLKTPLNLKELKDLSLYFDLKDFVRSNEQLFNDLNLSLERKEELFSAMSTHPVLMQRPIVTYKNQARIGRPPESVLALFA